MSRATLLLGSNLGDRAAFLIEATAQIAAHAGTIVQSTAVMRSEPWGYQSENFYLNQVVVVDTTIQPLELLDVLQSIELALGRTRPASSPSSSTESRIYADRTIDIDILYYDHLTLHNERLTLPHPRIRERPFVLALLSEL